MRRFFFQLFYFARAARRGLRASSGTAAIAVVTMAVALVLAGAFVLLVTNMQRVLARFGEELHVTAYLEPDLDSGAMHALVERVSTLPDVAHARLVTKAQALRRFRSRLGGTDLLEGLEGNPLPASIEVTLRPEARTPEGLRRVAHALGGLPGVSDLGAGQSWVRGYARAIAFVRGLGVVLGVVLALATCLIVANTIRLTAYARTDELEILALVGASRAYLRVPFLLEGMVQGACAGVLALGALFAGFHAVVPALGSGLSLFLGWSEPSFLSAGQMLALVAAGAGLGLFGAGAALAGSRSR